MPTSGEPCWAVDSSVAIAYLDETHIAHPSCVEMVGSRGPALAGHAMFEAYSVLTRLPGPTRVAGQDALAALRAAFPVSCWLNPEEHTALLDVLATTGVTGGLVYDALVGEAARVHNRTLLTRDRRAQRTYELLGVRYDLIA